MDFLVHHLLRASAARFPEKEALVHGDRRLSFFAVAEKVLRLAQGLRSAGVKRGDRVGLYLESSIEQVTSLLAVSQAGGIFVPMHHGLFPQQIAHIVNDSEIKVLITDAGRLEKLDEILHETPSLELIVVVGQGTISTTAAVVLFDALACTTPVAPWPDVAMEKRCRGDSVYVRFNRHAQGRCSKPCQHPGRRIDCL